MCRIERRRPLRQSGFVLATTLWLLAAIAIAVSMLMVWSHEQIAAAQKMRDQVHDRIALVETRDVVLYLVSTRPITLAGLSVNTLSADMLALRRLDEFGALNRDPQGDELSLADKVYQGVGDTRFSIQDEAGLVSVVNPSSVSIDALLGQLDVPAGRIAPLRDAFLDYVDEDSLVRLNGAEGVEYRQAGRIPPANRRLASPVEIERILGWDVMSPAQLQAWSNLSTPYYLGAVNLNTVPAALLPRWLPGCPENCERFVQFREQQPFRNAFQVTERLGVELPGDPSTDYRFLADDALRLTLWGRAGSALRLHVRWDQVAGQAGPWSIVAAYPVPRPEIDEPVQSTESLLFAQENPAVRR